MAQKGLIMGREFQDDASETTYSNNPLSAKSSNAASGSLSLKSGNSSHRNDSPIVHLTAVAAAKAAATALLTNQVIKRVRVALPDGRNANFKVQKCVIDSNSVLCSVAGTPEALSGRNQEICVRVAWERNLTPVTEKPSATPPPPQIMNQHVELHWLSLKMAVGQESPIPVNVPLLIHLAFSNKEEEVALRAIPRELVTSAIAEVLDTVNLERLERGVQVVLGLTSDNSERLPSLQTVAEVPLVSTEGWNYLFGSNPNPVMDRLALALDNSGAGVFPILESSHEAYINLSSSHLSLKAALESVRNLQQLNTLTVCGSPSALIALAFGKLNELEDSPLNLSFLSQIAGRYDMDPAIVQSLRNVTSEQDLLRVFRMRHLGWLFDRVCHLACLEIRKLNQQNVRIETMIFGGSGAILGQAALEPGIMRL